MLVLCITLVVDAGKQKGRKTRSSLSTSLAVENYQTKSLAEWRAMSMEALHLACNALHITATGPRYVVADRLYQFFHPSASVDGMDDAINETVVKRQPETLILPTLANNNTATGSNTGLSSDPVPQQDISTMIREEVQRALGNILANSHTSSLQQPSVDTPMFPHRPLASQPSNIAMSSSSSTLPEAMLPALLTNTLTHRQQQNRSTSQSVEGMPPLPQSVIDKIKNGEFVNFDLLLPNRSPVQSDEYTFKVIGGSTPSVALVPNNQKKPKVTDFNSWMVAWNNFIRSYGIFHPNRLHELIRYQAIICDLASQYTFSAWSQYDQMFRYQLAYNPELSWHRIDDDLYNRYVRGATLLSLCYLCKGFGHFASSCPNRPASSSASLQPFRAPQQQRSGHLARGSEPINTQTCHFYNDNGQCTHSRCRFAHQCRVCFGAHPNCQCPKRHSTR